MSDLPMSDELRGLLVELAEQPERALLGTRVRRFQDLLRPDVEVLRPTTGMGVVEKKLLEAHREELAHALLQASQIVLESREHLALKPRDVKGRAVSVDAREWRSRTSAVLASHIAAAQPRRSVELLEAVMQGEPGSRTSLRDLAVASIRLVPRQSTAIWLGLYCGIEGDAPRAIEIERGVLGQAPPHLLAEYALGNVARFEGELGRYHAALEAAHEAAAGGCELARTPVAWLIAAIQTDQPREFREAAAMLSDMLQEHSGELEEHVSFAVQSRQRGTWKPTAAAEAFLARPLQGTPPVAEKIIEVF